MPLREEPWGERLFQLTDPNGVVVQLVERAAEEEPAPTGEAAVTVITPAAGDVTESPNARMTGLAAPAGAARNSAPGPSRWKRAGPAPSTPSAANRSGR